MYHLLRSLGAKDAIRRELPAAGAALLIAESFYKFHSFTLELLAYLATWWILSWLAQSFLRAIAGKESGDGREAS